jgi:hypothetical protein
MPSTRQSGWRRLLAAAAIPLGLSGCGGNTAVHDFCLIYEPIYAAERDTPQTLKQIDEINGKYECLCRDDCPD